MTDYKKIFDFLSIIIQENRIDLYKFEEFCLFLKIPRDIKGSAKNILIKKSKIEDKLKGRKSFLTYIAAFFVSYVLLKCTYDDFKKKIFNLLQKFKNNPTYITRKINLNKLLSIILNENIFYLQLLNECLNPNQIEEFITNLYKIEILKFFKKLELENHLSLLYYNIKYEEALKPILYIIKNCFEPYEKFRKSRYSSASYFFLLKLKKLQLIDISIDPFFRIIGKSKKTLIDHIKIIKESLDYETFIENYPNFAFIKNSN